MQDNIKRIAIIGSRNYPRLDLVRQFVGHLNPLQHIVISGGAIGVDKVAEESAIKIGIPTKIYKAQWTTYGKIAGAIRNRQIVNGADEIYAFWDGISKGTLISINIAKELKKELYIFDKDGVISHEQ